MDIEILVPVAEGQFTISSASSQGRLIDVDIFYYKANA